MRAAGLGLLVVAMAAPAQTLAPGAEDYDGPQAFFAVVRRAVDHVEFAIDREAGNQNVRKIFYS